MHSHQSSRHVIAPLVLLSLLVVSLVIPTALAQEVPKLDLMCGAMLNAADSQATTAVRRFPRCSWPVGDGANRPLILTILPAIRREPHDRSTFRPLAASIP